MNCGECLIRDAKIAALVNGVCPVCGADYLTESERNEREAIETAERIKAEELDQQAD